MLAAARKRASFFVTKPPRPWMLVRMSEHRRFCPPDSIAAPRPRRPQRPPAWRTLTGGPIRRPVAMDDPPRSGGWRRRAVDCEHRNLVLRSLRHGAPSQTDIPSVSSMGSPSRRLAEPRGYLAALCPTLLRRSLRVFPRTAMRSAAPQTLPRRLPACKAAEAASSYVFYS
jgi:hypothetical protein